MVQEVIFLRTRKFLANLNLRLAGGYSQAAPSSVYADNETCIAWFDSEGSVGGPSHGREHARPA